MHIQVKLNDTLLNRVQQVTVVDAGDCFELTVMIPVVEIPKSVPIIPGSRMVVTVGSAHHGKDIVGEGTVTEVLEFENTFELSILIDQDK